MWMKRYSLALLIGLIFGQQATAQPGHAQDGSILITGATAHLGTGTAIERSAIGFSNGVINYVGTPDRVNQKQYDRIINAEGQHVYPGFIAANTTLGLAEIDQARPTRDYAEVGAFNPNVRSIIAYDAESMITPTTVTNGVLLAQIVPRSGVLSGTSSVVQLDAWNWEDAVVRMDDGVHLNWPRMTDKSGWYADFGELKTSENAERVIKTLEKFFRDAAAYCASGDKPAVNLRLQAMCGVLNGEQSLYIHANRVQDIAAAIHFGKDHQIEDLVIVGGADAWMIPEIFVENKVSLMLSRPHSLPDLPGDPIELPYEMPRIMSENKVPFCLQNYGRFERMQLRNFPFNAGTAVAHGLPYEHAVEAITLSVAAILGVDGHYGSLEPGKSATLFISSGDALEMRTNEVTHAFIDGRSVNLVNRQEKLYHQYRKKYSE